MLSRLQLRYPPSSLLDHFLQISPRLLSSLRHPTSALHPHSFPHPGYPLLSLLLVFLLHLVDRLLLSFPLWTVATLEVMMDDLSLPTHSLKVHILHPWLEVYLLLGPP